MAGVCGIIGSGDHHLEAVAADLQWTGEEKTTNFESDEVSIFSSFTSEVPTTQPISVGDDSLLWVWGSIAGVETHDGYKPRKHTDTTADHCARLYDRYGMEFVTRLNGDFFGLVYDRGAGSVSLFTDRIGLRDAYYTQPDGETFVFSTAIQSLSRHPDVTPAFDTEYITEYFSCHNRTFGVETPLVGTSLFPPGSVTTIEVDTLDRTVDRYWTPRYEPQDRPFSAFVEAFSRRFHAAVNERLQADKQYGLLLSGGIDSRLVLAAVEPQYRGNLTAYHMADWWSREARIAAEAAEAAGVDFEYLERDPEYTERALSRNPKLSNFVGTFEQAHAEGFMPEIRSEVDEMLTASFADSNFKGYSFPQRQLRVGPIGTVMLPWLKSMDSIDDYIEFWMTDPPAYLHSSSDAESVLRREIYPTEAGIEHHGITYPSPRDLFIGGALTPRTNGSVLFILQSLRQHCPAWSPYVDNRLVELCLSMPMRFFTRRNIIAAAMERLDSDLAKVPYANTGLPVTYPQVAHVVGEHAVRFKDRYLPTEDPPKPYVTNGPWPNHAEVIRSQSFVEDALRRNEGKIRKLPFLDWDGVWECYDEHMSGTNNRTELYGLLTLLEMPITERIVKNRE